MRHHLFRTLALCVLLASHPLMAQDSTVIRLVTVPVPFTSGLLNTLLPDFQRDTGYRVQVVFQTQDIYQFARNRPPPTS